MARQKCNYADKDKFPSKLEADLAILAIQRKNRRRKYRDEPVRSYQCEACHCWHMTSQAMRSESRVRQ